MRTDMVPLQAADEDPLLHHLQDIQLGSSDDVHTYDIRKELLFMEPVFHGAAGVCGADISFSTNDYVLNTLLNILPQKIYLHLVSPFSNLDFLNTLQLIFENRIKLCHDCNICNIYKRIIKNKTGIEK